MEWIITRLIKSIQKVFWILKLIVTNVHIVIHNEKAKQVLKLLISGACATVSNPLIIK